jgi:hypothetical protein
MPIRLNHHAAKHQLLPVRSLTLPKLSDPKKIHYHYHIYPQGMEKVGVDFASQSSGIIILMAGIN